jgi:hypothetical protein
MIASFSPLTRRVLAIGLLVLLVLGAIQLVIAPIYSLTANSLSDLQDARFRRARLESIAARPPLPASAPVPASLYVTAPDRQRATDLILAAISGSAGRYQVQIDSIAPLPEQSSRGAAIAVTVAARGEHDKVLAWINELERGTPNVHFADWSLAPDGSASAAAAGAGTAMPGLSPVPSPDAAAGPGAPAAPGAPLRLIFGGTAVAVWGPVQ